MANASIPIQTPTDIDNRLDAESVVVGGISVLRERVQVAGNDAAEIAAVQNVAPVGTEYGLVVRMIGAVVASGPSGTPVTDHITSANLANGASVDLDATVIAAAKTGRLRKVVVGSSVSCKWQIKTRDGAAEIVRGTVFTRALQSFEFIPPDDDLVTQAGDGADTNFRVTATNLDDNLAADVYATVFWREV